MTFQKCPYLYDLYEKGRTQLGRKGSDQVKELMGGEISPKIDCFRGLKGPFPHEMRTSEVSWVMRW